MAKRKRTHTLTRNEILDAALKIVDSEGLAALTMRRLGLELHVDPMMIYRHIPNKDELLSLTVERMREGMTFTENMPDDPGEMLEVIFSEYRRVLAAHPNMLPLATRRVDSPETSGLTFLIDHGLPSQDAVELYQSLTAFTIGFALLESPLADNKWADNKWTGSDGLPANCMTNWEEATFKKALRTLIKGFGLGG